MKGEQIKLNKTEQDDDLSMWVVYEDPPEFPARR